MDSKLTYDQTRIFGPKAFDYFEEKATITAEVRYDDQCRNGHNTFSITGTIRKAGTGRHLAGGCIHDEVSQAFPELAPYIKWHLCSSDEPMHYIANTVYLAGNRDHNGKLAGEPLRFVTAIQFGRNPIKHYLKGSFTQLEGAAPYDFEVIRIDHDDPETFAPKYTFGGFDDKWYQCPFDREQDALDFLEALHTCEPQFVRVVVEWGKGKARELDAARRAAIWLDATDEELTAPGLEERLKARHPKLMAEFRAAVESLNFTW